MCLDLFWIKLLFVIQVVDYQNDVEERGNGCFNGDMENVEFGNSWI